MEKPSIDLGLAILATHARRHETFDYGVIAAFCDCDEQTIRNIERRALQKARRLIKKETPEAQVAAEV